MNKMSNSEDSFAVKLFNLRKSPSSPLPDKPEVENFARELLDLFFPHFTQKNFETPDKIHEELICLEKKLCEVIHPFEEELKISAKDLSYKFFDKIPELYDKLLLDAESIARNDPAATNIDEVILSYPGFLAIAIYRIAHEFNLLKIPLFPRVLTEYAHRETGIDIHPQAQIGKSFCIDHGTGIVIGQTTVIGDNVKLYQGVTLGALSVAKEMANKKRHPTIEDNCIIYSNATILGGETIIGHNSIIGGNVWLTNGVPPYSVVYHKSEIKFGSAKDSPDIINFVI